MEEQARIDEASLHVDDPRRPGLLYGVPPMEVLAMADEWADQAKDSRGYKMKSDGSVAIVGVASLPREMEDDFPEFAENTLKWLKEKYGDRLKSVVVHDDEPHPIYILRSYLARVSDWTIYTRDLKPKMKPRKISRREKYKILPTLEQCENYKIIFMKRSQCDQA